METITPRSAFGLTAAAVCLAMCAAATGQEPASPPTAAPATRSAIDVRKLMSQTDPEFWRVANRCGLNAVYLYLSLTGRPVGYGELEADIPITDKGSSLAELGRVAEKHGARSVIVKATPETLPTLLPAIVHTEEQSHGGHFVVVVKIENDQITLIDGTSGIVSTYSLAEFNKMWTGYALVPARDTEWAWQKTGLGSALAAALGLGVWFAVRGRKPRHTLAAPTHKPHLVVTTGPQTSHI